MEAHPTPQENIPLKNIDRRYLKVVGDIVEYLREYYKKQSSSNDEYFAIFIKNNISINKMFKVSDLFENTDEIEELVERYVQNSDIYHSILTFAEARRSNETAIKRTKFVFIDIERTDHQPLTTEEVKNLIDFLDNIALEYSEIRNSGRGLHIVIELNEPLNLENEYDYYSDITLLNNMLDNDYKVDNIYDFARVIRVLHSLNTATATQVTTVAKSTTVSKQKYKKFIDRLREETKKKEELEKETDSEEVYEIEEEKLEDFTKDLYIIIKDYYKEGTRHNLMFFTLATIYKYSTISNETLRKIAERLCELLGDEEVKMRLRIVDSLTQMSDKSSVATISFFYDFSENRERRLSSFARANNLAENEALEILKKLKSDIIELMRKYSIIKFRKGLIGRELLKWGDRRRVYVEVYSDSVLLSKYRKMEDLDSWYRYESEAFIRASVILKAIYKKITDDAVIYLYDISFRNNDTRIDLSEKTLEEIAKTLANTRLVTAKSKSDIEKILTAVVNILARKYNIKEQEVVAFFDMGEDYSIIDPSTIMNEFIRIEDQDIENILKALRVINSIKQDELIFILLGTSISSLFSEETKLKPFVLIWGTEGLGKSTVSRLFTEKMWGNKSFSADAFDTTFRIVRVLEFTRTAVLIDDIKKIDSKVFNFIKAYTTGLDTVIRGKSNLDVEKIKARATIIMTANDRLKTTDTAILDRTIEYHVTDYTFKDHMAATEAEEVRQGWGYVIANLILHYLREEQKKFYDIFQQEYLDLVRNLDLEMNFRRKKIYAMFSAGIKVLIETFERLEAYEETEELKRRLIEIYENKYVIIRSIENSVSDDTVSFFAKTILEQIIEEDELLIKTDDKIIITTVAFNKFSERHPEYALRSLSELAKAIRGAGVNAKYTTIRIGDRVVRGVVISKNEIEEQGITIIDF